MQEGIHATMKLPLTKRGWCLILVVSISAIGYLCSYTFSRTNITNNISGYSKTVLNFDRGLIRPLESKSFYDISTTTPIKHEEIFHSRCYNPPKHKQVTHPLTAQQIADSLAKRIEISPRTLQDITEAIKLNVISINESDINNIKIILGYHGYEHTPHYTWYNFTHCEYTNCIPLNPHRSPSHPMAPTSVAQAASIMLFNLVEMYQGTTLKKIPRRSDQYFGVTSLESTGYSYNVMSPNLNGLINMTLTYHRKSTVPEWHIFRACIDKHEQKKHSVNYAAGKTKGALAYVSNCFSMQYNRLDLMRKLSKFVPVDIYGSCGAPDPCGGLKPSQKSKCSAALHQQYHFYLSFENSLCEDYITEKFWDRLSDPDYMLPVAMGGLSVQEYVEQAPPNSFLHVRNFTTVEKLGKYLNYLMKNPTEYNAYHEWRESWHAFKRPIYTRFPSCELCKIANEKPSMPADDDLSTKYNNPAFCSSYTYS